MFQPLHPDLATLDPHSDDYLALVNRLIADRRAELSVYCDLVAENTGRRPDLRRALDRDDVHESLLVLLAAALNVPTRPAVAA